MRKEKNFKYLSFEKRIFVSGLLLLFFFIFVIAKFFVSSPEAPLAKELIIRVRLADDLKNTKILPESSFFLYQTPEAKGFYKPRPSSKINIKAHSRGIRFGNRVFATERLRINPIRDSAIKFNGVWYTGSLVVLRTSRGLEVINFVGIEDYLKGVVPREMHFWWPLEVLKAQAIAARSYALYRMLRSESLEHDVTADTRTQVYGGRSAWTLNTSRAVQNTEGKVLFFAGELLPGYYHACCGGHTQDISNIWHGENEALKGVVCRACRWSPHYKWEKEYTKKEVTELLNAGGYELESFGALLPGLRDGSGRLDKILVETNGQWFQVPIKKFRGLLGRSRIKSTNFFITEHSDLYRFKGSGWGHGVGLCQWGAFFRGMRRWSASRILEYYYPGTEIVSFENIL